MPQGAAIFKSITHSNHLFLCFHSPYPIDRIY
jgi:hypothetical protein